MIRAHVCYMPAVGDNLVWRVLTVHLAREGNVSMMKRHYGRRNRTFGFCRRVLLLLVLCLCRRFPSHQARQQVSRTERIIIAREKLD